MELQLLSDVSASRAEAILSEEPSGDLDGVGFQFTFHDYTVDVGLVETVVGRDPGGREGKEHGDEEHGFAEPLHGGPFWFGFSLSVE